LLQHCKSFGRSPCRSVLPVPDPCCRLPWQPVLAQSPSPSLVNGSFESGSGSNIPGWTFVGAGSASIVVKGTNKRQPTCRHRQPPVQMTVAQPGTMYLGSTRVTVSPNLRFRFTPA